jgi:hypothetical protein
MRPAVLSSEDRYPVKPPAKWKILARAIVVAAAVAGMAVANAEERIFRPTQAAYLKGEIKRIQNEFVARISAISGVPAARIREWVATDGRDVPPRLSIVPALQRARGKPLSDEERAQIVAADQAHFDAIARAKQEALKK